MGGAVEQVSGQPTDLDILDRVLNKGVVIDAWRRVSFVGIDLLTVRARVVVASIQAYMLHSPALGTIGTLHARPSQPHAPARTTVRRS